MIEKIQSILSAMGKWGCYFLSVLQAGEAAGGKASDPIQKFIVSKNYGWIRDDCFMLKPDLLMTSILGGSWEVLKSGDGHELPLVYMCRKDEIEILRFQRDPDEGESADDCAHFVVGNGRGQVAYDPWGDSRTVREGKLISKRIFRRT